MLRKTLNLGILAHVDAGKTTLTERLLHAAGVIDEIGSVDDGTTQTDSLALEQQRGITIKSAVVSFELDDVTVNLIDTPGHPDFIAEVERALGVLDGVVLVVAAVEGVQPQTLVLMRALQRLRIPALIFVNKVDRRGADYERALQQIQARLTPAAIGMGSVADAGTRDAGFVPHPDDDPAFATRLVELLSDHDDRLLAAYVEDGSDIPPRRLRTALADQTHRALVYPVFAGSALTGAGVDALTAALVELLPTSAGEADGPLSASVFKIERGPGGEKIAYMRVFSGTLNVRDRLRIGDAEAKVTSIRVFDCGTRVQQSSVTAGRIAQVSGLGDVRIGDALGNRETAGPRAEFRPPTLQSVVEPIAPADRQRLREALAQLAEQDPLINVEQDDARHEITVSLYGEVQKEVIQATLANDYALEVAFRESTPICVERPADTGEAAEILHADSNPFLATIALRIDPAPEGSGIEFRLAVDHRAIPLYVYKSREAFGAAMENYVRAGLRHGLFGWQVVDCIVTMTACNYSSPDGPPSTRGPLSGVRDFKKLTPIVLRRGLEQAGTIVCEPTFRVRLDVPATTIGAVTAALAELAAEVEQQTAEGAVAIVAAVLPAARVDELQRLLPKLTAGEGVLEAEFAGFRPARTSSEVR